MIWDEPLEIARRLATALGVRLGRWPERRRAAAGVLLTSAEALAEIPADRLGTAATVVRGEAPEATSAALRGLCETVAERGLSVALAAFATGPDGAEVPLVVGVPADDERVGRLLAAGPHALPLDAALDVAAVTRADVPARVCVVSFEVSGMTGGGIGTASTSLAETLARAGHDVTLLFTGWQERGAEAGNEAWRRHYAERGVRLAILREPGVDTVKNPHFPARSAYEVYCWLRREAPFDVVHLPENMGHGAYAQAAKRQGAHFAGTTFVVGTHGPTRWAAEANRVALTREEFLVNEALERTSVALADVLLGPSRYLHDHLRARGWSLPERVHVQPYAVPSAVRARAAGSDGAVPDAVRVRSDDRFERPAESPPPLPSEIVFFGRLETRKGVATLCDALDLLAAETAVPPFSVTFLGPVAEVLGQPADAYIADRARRWPWPWQVVADRDQQGAAEYLARPGVLAVMPSTVDNAPNTVSEAVALGIPLVAGRSGGTGELVAAVQRDDHMFGEAPGATPLPSTLTSASPAPDAAPLAQLLVRRLTERVEPARAPSSSEAVDEAYDRWHRAVRRARRAGDAAPPPRGALPTLAICLLFDGDERLLEEQLDALAGAGPDADVEVVVADLREDETPVETTVPVVRPARPGHAADARVAALAATHGELLVLFPPGDVPLPGFVEAARGAAAAAPADAYGFVLLDRIADTPHDGSDGADAMARAFVPLAGPAVAGLTHPAFAVGPYAVRRTALEQIGGFAADARGDEVDHELLNRVAAAGRPIEVVPEPLGAKRRADRWTAFRSQWPHERPDVPYDAEQWLRIERPLAAHASVADLLGLLRGARDERRSLREETQTLRDAYETRVAEQRAWIDGLERTVGEWRTVGEAKDRDIREAHEEIQRLEAERLRLVALTEEMRQSAAQLVVRAARNGARRLPPRRRT